MQKTETLPELKGEKSIDDQMVIDAKIKIKSILTEHLGAAVYEVVDYLLETFFELLKAHRIEKFTADDLFRLLDPKYHGVKLDGIRKIELSTINHWLTRFVSGTAGSNVDLHCTPDGVFSFTSAEKQVRLKVI